MAGASRALEGATSAEPRPSPPQLPEGGFYYPFQGPRLRLGATQEMQHPRTVSAGAPTQPSVSCPFHRQIVELRMRALSRHHIREKPNWRVKVKNEEIVGPWREEVLQ